MLMLMLMLMIMTPVIRTDYVNYIYWGRIHYYHIDYIDSHSMRIYFDYYTKNNPEYSYMKNNLLRPNNLRTEKNHDFQMYHLMILNFVNNQMKLILLFLSGITG